MDPFGPYKSLGNYSKYVPIIRGTTVFTLDTPVRGGIGNTLIVDVQRAFGLAEVVNDVTGPLLGIEIPADLRLKFNEYGRVFEADAQIGVNSKALEGTPLSAGFSVSIAGDIISVSNDTGTIDNNYNISEIDTALRQDIERVMASAGLGGKFDDEVNALLKNIEDVQGVIGGAEEVTRKELNDLVGGVTEDGPGESKWKRPPNDGSQADGQFGTEEKLVVVDEIFDESNEVLLDVVFVTVTETVWQENPFLEPQLDSDFLENFAELADLVSAQPAFNSAPVGAPLRIVVPHTPSAAMFLDLPETPSLSGSSLGDADLPPGVEPPAALSLVNMDLDGDGQREYTTWFGDQLPVIVYDTDGLGDIDTSYAMLNLLADGKTALSDADTNDDGSVEFATEGSGRFFAWRDLNINGIKDVGELTSLEDLGYESILLEDFDTLAASISFINGTGDATDGAIVQLATFPETQTQFTTVPSLRGFAYLPTTEQSYAADPSLLLAAEAIVADLGAENYNAIVDDFEAFLFHWAGVTGLDPDLAVAGVDMRKAAFLEMATGYDIVEEPALYPTADQVYQIDAAFAQLKALIFSDFLGQSHELLSLDNIDQSGRPSDYLPSYFFLTAFDQDDFGTSTWSQTWFEPFATSLAQMVENDEMSAADASVFFGLVADAINTSTAEFVALAGPVLADILDSYPSAELAVLAALDTAPTIGTEQNDTITTGDESQIVLGDYGDDKIYDGAGDDAVFGGNGFDRFYAGDGADAYYGGEDNRDNVLYIYSTEGLTIDMNDASNSTGIAEGDTFDSIERVHATNYDDIIYLADGVDMYDARNGDDIIHDAGGYELMKGGNGADTFVLVAGDGQQDRIHDFTSGVDNIDISSWDVTLWSEIDISLDYSNAGNLRGIDVSSVSESILLSYLDGDDMALLTAADFGLVDDSSTVPPSDGTLSGTSGNDTINVGFTDADGDVWNNDGQLVESGDGFDNIYDGSGDDVVVGGAGIDRFWAGAGADTYDGGGDHRDEVRYQLSDVGLTINMNDTSLSTGIAQGDTYANIERVQGTNYDDVIFLADGVDAYNALDGDDIIHDANGFEFMQGGNGSDRFVFVAGDGQRDRIHDFEIGMDYIDISSWGATSVSDLSFTAHSNAQGSLIISFGSEDLQINNLTLSDVSSLTSDRFDFG